MSSSEESYIAIIKCQIFMFNGALAFRENLNALDLKSYPRYSQVLE